MVTVTVPNGAEVTCHESDPNIASAEWLEDWKGNKAYLRITGHCPGDATITLTYGKSKKKVKIRVSVGANDIATQLLDPNEDSSLYRLKIYNNSGKTISVDRADLLHVWSLDDDGKLVASNVSAHIRSTPIGIGNGTSRVISFSDDTPGSQWDKFHLALLVGNKRKTLIIDSWGMTREIRNGLYF